MWQHSVDEKLIFVQYNKRKPSGLRCKNMSMPDGKLECNSCRNDLCCGTYRYDVIIPGKMR